MGMMKNAKTKGKNLKS